jgi:hypothetical protein
LDNTPDEVEARVEAFTSPAGLPESLVTSLDAKLSTAVGLARWAYLVGTTYESGVRSHMVGFVGAVPAAQGALTKAVAEALTFSGIDAGALDVGFFETTDTVAAQLARVGLRFDLPVPEAAADYPPIAPGSDPEKPPKLR